MGRQPIQADLHIMGQQPIQADLRIMDQQADLDHQGIPSLSLGLPHVMSGQTMATRIVIPQRRRMSLFPTTRDQNLL